MIVGIVVVVVAACIAGASRQRHDNHIHRDPHSAMTLKPRPYDYERNGDV